MEKKDKKRIIAGAAVLGGTGIAALLLRRRREEEAPPAEGYGRIWGYIKNSQTGERVSGANVYLDDVQEDTTDKNGMYGTGYVPFGQHTLVVEAANYEKLCETIVISEASAKVEILMDPLSEAPTEWTEGVEVTKIKVEPDFAYVGETITIKVYIQYPDPLPLPVDIYGSVLVNGTLVSGVWSIHFRNPTLSLEYITSLPGSFMVRAQDKSAVFQVEAAPAGTFYPPWGGVRMPICTEITIPNVNPFEAALIMGHPGGDLKYEGRSLFTIPARVVSAIEKAGSLDRIYEAYPSKWSPPGAQVAEYVKEVNIGSRDTEILIMATDYACHEFWPSLNELAAMIAEGLGYGGIGIPKEWQAQYGKVCSVCGGTGITDKCPYCGGTGELEGSACPYCHGSGRRHSGTGACWNCGGSGYVLRVDLRKGWRDWVKGLKYNSICGGGSCTPRLYCPYAYEHGSGEKDYVKGSSHTQALSWDVESFVRLFLRHIEDKHPNHPLTKQAWV